jgi:hypothetical protein
MVKNYEKEVKQTKKREIVKAIISQIFIDYVSVCVVRAGSRHYISISA